MRQDHVRMPSQRADAGSASAQSSLWPASHAGPLPRPAAGRVVGPAASAACRVLALAGMALAGAACSLGSEPAAARHPPAGSAAPPPGISGPAPRDSYVPGPEAVLAQARGSGWPAPLRILTCSS
jgi:hypothetical protein